MYYCFRYVFECVECGVIYCSCQYWYGNDDLIKIVVRIEFCYVWLGVSLNYGFCQFVLGFYIVDEILRCEIKQDGENWGVSCDYF